MHLTRRRILAGAACMPFLRAQTSEYVVPEVPYVPTPQEVVEAMLTLGEVKKGDTLYDLGCGDGRIVVTAAKQYGTRGIGIDIDPQRIREAEDNARKTGVSNLVTFKQQDLFQTDLAPASVVTLYLLSSVNMRLRPKLQKELKPGTRVVSHRFDMGDWKPDKQVDSGGRPLYLWRIK